MQEFTSQLMEIPLQQIAVTENNPRKNFDKNALKELTESVKKVGVLQPILVREIPEGAPKDVKQKYELVCGERRYRAAVVAKLKTLPANIRELSDDEAFEMMIIENLERKDVHPLEEADAFQKMLDSGRYTMEDIAAKVVRTERYIAQRLKFSDLIPEIKKEFFENQIGIGHAVQLARITEKHQKEVFKHCVTESWRGGWGSVSKLKDIIERGLNQLNKAAFDMIDKKLLPKIGSCLECPKRSGANKLLFSDIDEEDVCFDNSCFNLKLKAHLNKMIEKAANEDSDIILCKESYLDVPNNVAKKIEKTDMVVKDEYKDLSSWDKSGKKVKVLMVNGREAGMVKEMYLRKGKTDKKDDSLESQIEKIETRMKRNLELAGEKAWTEIIDFDSKETPIDGWLFKDAPGGELNQVERLALAVSLGNSSWQSRDESEFLKSLKVEDLEKTEVPVLELNRLLRQFIDEQLRTSYGSTASSVGNAVFTLVMRHYYQKEVEEIENKYLQHYQAKNDRAEIKLNTLKAELKAKQPKRKMKRKKTA